MADNVSRKSLKVAFLYNHDISHQIAHSAPIAVELTRNHPDVDVSIITSSDQQNSMVREIFKKAGVMPPNFIRITLPAWAEFIDKIARYFSPFRRVAHLFCNIDLFSRFDAIVAPETTTALLKTKFGLEGVKLIYTQHGAGDAAIGFKPIIRAYDFVLASGVKVRDRLLSMHCITQQGHAVIGYPKFDLIAQSATKKPKLFANENPVIFYNPHCNPNLSSWFDWGDDVLDFFAANPQYNLIVAPHVMLFQRRIHISLDGGKIRWRRDIPAKYLKCSNIRFDLGGTACLDMTYALAADIYMGDVSSQIYEFMIHARPCFFLNPQGIEWQGNDNFTHWHYGQVISDIADLGSNLERAETDFAKYKPVQEVGFAKTFDLGEISSSVRAAEAIPEFLYR